MSFVTADQLVAAAIGDYILQSDWMAVTKTKRSIAAATHALVYGLPFLFLTWDPRTLGFIIGTHFVIDRWRLARYVVWVKNFLAPRSAWPPPFHECAATGYPPGRPAWLVVWLLIIADNVMHALCNAAAFHWWS